MMMGGGGSNGNIINTRVVADRAMTDRRSIENGYSSTTMEISDHRKERRYQILWQQRLQQEGTSTRPTLKLRCLLSLPKGEVRSNGLERSKKKRRGSNSSTSSSGNSDSRRKHSNLLHIIFLDWGGGAVADLGVGLGLPSQPFG